MDAYIELFKNGKEKMNSKDYHGAISEFDIAINLHPDFADFYLERAKCKLYCKDYLGVIDDYEKVKRLNYCLDSSIYNNMGVAYAELDYTGNAIKSFNLAIEVDQNNVDAIENLHILTSEIKNKLHRLQRLLELTPKKATVILEMAELKTILLDYNGALLNYNEIVFLQNDDPLSYEARGNFKLYHLKDFKGAINDFDMSIEIYPNEEVIMRRAKAKIELSDIKEAIIDLNLILELYPSFELKVETYCKLAELKSNLKEFAASIASYSKLIQIDKENPQYFKARASLRYNTQDIRGAIDDWEIATQLNPNDKDSLKYIETSKNYLNRLQSLKR